MSAADVKEILADETIMLDIMIGCLQQIDTQKFSHNHSKFIHDSWIRFLRERRHAGVQLQTMKSNALLADLKKERKQVGAYIKCTPFPRKFCEQWDEFLMCEKKILNKLIKLLP